MLLLCLMRHARRAITIQKPTQTAPFMIHALVRRAAQSTYFGIFLSSQIACAIIILSLSPLPQLPEVAGSDKTHHLIAYAALAFPTAFAKGRYFAPLVGAYLGLGGVIELIQPYVNR